MRSLIFFALLSCSADVFAASFAFDVDLFSFQDTFSNGGVSSSYTRTMWDLAPLVALDKKAHWLLGWNYDSMSFSDSPAAVPTTLTVTNMGPKIVYYFDKDRTWVTGFTYDLITTGNFTSAGATSQFRGTALKAEFGYTPEMFSGVMMGAKMNYYKATFNEQVVSTTLTKVSDGRTVIYPTFAITIRWD